MCSQASKLYPWMTDMNVELLAELKIQMTDENWWRWWWRLVNDDNDGYDDDKEDGDEEDDDKDDDDEEKIKSLAGNKLVENSN